MSQQAQASVVLTGGVVFDGTGTAPFPGDVHVVGNRIEAVVPAADRQTFSAETTRIQLDGRTVMPGLVEGHAHISFTGVGDLMDLARLPIEENLIAAIGNAALLLDLERLATALPVQRGEGPPRRRRPRAS